MGSFAIILVAQLLVGVVAPCFQVVGPRYAEVWFDLKGRATATMIVAICTFLSVAYRVENIACSPLPPADPLGTAVGQIVAPFLTNIRFGILFLAILTSAALPLSFAVLPKPPSPPSNFLSFWTPDKMLVL